MITNDGPNYLLLARTLVFSFLQLCLGNMGHARGAAAVRLAKKEPEPEVAIAQVWLLVAAGLLCIAPTTMSGSVYW